MDAGTIPARYHRAFNDRDFVAWREIFDEDADLVVDGVAYHGIDAAVGYGVVTLKQFPGLYIASARVVARSADTVVTEVSLVNGDPAGEQSRRQGTACEIWRVRDGRAVSVHSYYMAEPEGRADAVRVPSRGEAAVVAEEQAALRRVATLVARGVSEDELFRAVTQEIGWLVAADATSLLRFGPDDTVRLVAAWSAQPADLPIGSTRRVDDILRSIRDTGRPWRRGPAEPLLTGAFVDEARALGLRTFVGVPIVVDGRVWGVAFASSAGDRPFADDAETRLAGFTELVAIAFANAQARSELRGFAEEQAALRRVATLVARVAPPQEVFASVSAEIGQLLRADFASMGRYDPDGGHAIVAAWSGGEPEPAPVGRQWTLGGRNLVSQVFETGRPARIDDYAGATGVPAAIAVEWGVRAAVGVPVVVEGRLWGVMMVASARAEPLPADTEARLARFTELVATAIANAESQSALAVSRARIVAAADQARRRIERNLHDGAQQRLISLALHLRGTVRAAVPAGVDELAAQLDDTVTEILGVLDELREIARGLHPAALADGGLGPALSALARRSTVPVRLEVGVEGRLAEPVELAAYYVVAEALTNVAKHADASVVDVQVTADNEVLRVGIRDDGRGGADPTRGSGLVGLSDRVEALGGRLSLRSPPGAGTTVQVSVPLGGR